MRQTLACCVKPFLHERQLKYSSLSSGILQVQNTGVFITRQCCEDANGSVFQAFNKMEA